MIYKNIPKYLSARTRGKNAQIEQLLFVDYSSVEVITKFLLF